MGSHDYRHRETKKVKKGAKKLTPINIVPAATVVEVVRKGKKEPEVPEE